jgi:hypothetical protein
MSFLTSAQGNRALDWRRTAEKYVSRSESEKHCVRFDRITPRCGIADDMTIDDAF